MNQEEPISFRQRREETLQRYLGLEMRAWLLRIEPIPRQVQSWEQLSEWFKSKKNLEAMWPEAERFRQVLEPALTETSAWQLWNCVNQKTRQIVTSRTMTDSVPTMNPFFNGDWELVAQAGRGTAVNPTQCLLEWASEHKDLVNWPSLAKDAARFGIV